METNMKLGEIQIRTSVCNYARSPVCLQPLGNASMVTDLQELSLGMPLELANFLSAPLAPLAPLTCSLINLVTRNVKKWISLLTALPEHAIVRQANFSQPSCPKLLCDAVMRIIFKHIRTMTMTFMTMTMTTGQWPWSLTQLTLKLEPYWRVKRYLTWSTYIYILEVWGPSGPSRLPCYVFCICMLT